MSEHPILKQQDAFKHRLDFLGTFSRTQRSDVMGMERGRVSIGGRRPVNACFVVYDNAYAFFFGFNLLGAGLRFKPHHMDFMIPIQDVTALHVGGANQQTASQYASSDRLHLQTGQPLLQLTCKGRETAQFVPEDNSTISRTSIVASKILAGHRTAYSGELRGTSGTPHPPAQPAPETQHTEHTWEISEKELTRHRPEQVMPAAMRYFPSSDTYDVGWESYVLPCQRGVNGPPYLVPGYLILEQENFGFFEPADIVAQITHGRSPLVGKISDLTYCGVELPADVTISAPTAVSLSNSETSDDNIKLELDTDASRDSFWIEYGRTDLSLENKAATLILLEAVLERIGESAALEIWDD